MDMQFFVNRSYITANGVDTDVHSVSYLLVGIAFGEKIEEFLLSGCQFGDGGVFLGRTGQELDYPPGQLWSHRGTTLIDVPDGLDQFRRGRSFQKIATGSR